MTLAVPYRDRPYFSPVFFPTLPELGLSEDERNIIARLQMKGWRQRERLELENAYYNGLQIIADLNIAIPPELQFLRVIVGWPRIAVDPFVERLAVDGFRIKGGTDADEDLSDLWDANGLDADLPLAITDALVMRRAWLTVGSPDEDGGSPKMCVESPLNIVAEWDPRTMQPKNALQTFWQDGHQHALLYIPGQTIHVATDDTHTWQLEDRDKYQGLGGRLPLIRMANQARTYERDGFSEITPELMSITDSACRTLRRMDIAGEFYSVPQKLILGATEADFVDKDGNKKSAWSTYISRVLAIERDENGDIPTVHQFSPHDPSVFTKQIEMYASQAAGIMGANPQDLGLYTQGNPVSADAYNVIEARRDRRAVMKQRSFGVALVEWMQMGVRFMNQGTLPDEFQRMYCDWVSPQLPNFAATMDGLGKGIAAGMIPPRSNVTLKRAGFSAAERVQLEADAQNDEGMQVLAQIADDPQLKHAAAGVQVMRELNAPTTPNNAPGGNPPTPTAG